MAHVFYFTLANTLSVEVCGREYWVLRAY